MEGKGLQHVLSGLELGRINVAARGVGVAQSCLDESVRYSQERKTFGKPICQHQAIQIKLADMVTRTEAARLLTERAAVAYETGQRCDMEAGIAKLFATEAALENSIEAMRIHGGYGYSKEFPIERMYRDAPLLCIGEGTNEIQRLIIARQLIERNPGVSDDAAAAPQAPPVRPLEGLTVVSIEQYGAAPFGTMYLADLGADVIKIENHKTGGEMGRHVLPYAEDGDSLFYQTFSCNKRCLALDLKKPRGREILERLAGRADALINNLRGDLPGALGLDYASLGAVNPRLVCVHLSAYGRDNERAAWPGPRLRDAGRGRLPFHDGGTRQRADPIRALGRGFHGAGSPRRSRCSRASCGHASPGRAWTSTPRSTTWP